MSAETKAALEAAIAEHVLDEAGEDAGAWVLAVETTSIDDLANSVSSMWREASDCTSQFTLRGLAETLCEDLSNGLSPWGTDD